MLESSSLLGRFSFTSTGLITSVGFSQITRTGELIFGPCIYSVFFNPFCFTLSCFAAPLLYSSSSLPVVLSNLCMHNSIPIKDFCDTNVWATHCSNSMYSHSLSPLHAQVIMMLTLSWFSLFSLQIRVPKSELCTVCRRREIGRAHV